MLMWFTQRQVRLCWCWCENVGRVFVVSAAATCSLASVLIKGDNRSRGGSVLFLMQLLPLQQGGVFLGGGEGGSVTCLGRHTAQPTVLTPLPLLLTPWTGTLIKNSES